MTAAVIPSALLPPVAPPDHPSADRHSGDQHTARPAGRRTRNTPYLVPVPDCEPPFDDEVGHPRRTSLQLSTGAAVHPNPDDANRGHGPDAATTDLAPETFGRARPNSAPEPSIGSPASTDPAPSDPGQEDPDNRSVWRRDRPPIPSRPLRTPRSEPSPGLRASPQSDVLLLEPAPRGRPTTIVSSSVPPWSSEADIGVRKTASQHLPPVDRAASVLARALVEVLSGQRPLAQLRVHCAPEIFAGLTERPPAPPMALPHLLTVRVCEPADGVAEVSVAFRRADRVRALAFRIEGVDGRWRITALQLG